MTPYRSHFLLALMLSLVMTTLALGQIRSGTITGTIADSAGALVPDASVVVVNQQTNATIELTSSSAGEFTAPYLPAGIYSVLVKKEGFQPYRKTDIALGSSQTVRVDVPLALSTLQSVVEVRAEVIQLQGETSSVQGAVDQKAIASIPNVTHNPLVYATLQAGVTPHNSMLNTASPDSFGIGFQSRYNFSAFSVNGGAAFTNDIQLDGLSVQGSAWNEAAVLPNPDAIQEVRVNANNFAADLGRGMGVVSMITKSGTNSFHGGLNYQNRNEALNANSFFNNAMSIPRGPFKVHQFGGNVGGPIIKDKLFFFTSYEHLIHSDPASWLLTVPTAAERAGNFGQTMIQDQNGNPIPAQIYDPYSVVQLGPNLYQRTLIPNATILNPNPLASKIYNSYPEPNRPPSDAFGSNNFFVQKTRTFSRNSSNNRIDYHLGTHSIYGSGGIQQGSIATPRPFGDDSPFYQPPTSAWQSEFNRDKNPYGAIGDTIVLSPTLIVDLRYGINRINNDSIAGSNSSFDYSAFGVPEKVQAIVPYPGVALDIQAPGYSPLAQSIYMQKRERQTNHMIAASATKVLSRWTLKAGTESRTYLSNYTDFESGSAMLNGWANSIGNYTAQYADAAGNGVAQNQLPQQNGLDKASLMTGAGGYYVSAGFGVRPAFAQKLFALYSQNDWRVTPKLTINLGLRWEVQPGPTDRYNRISAIDLGAPNPYFGQGKVAFAGADGYSRNLWDTEWDDIQPRLGVAYRLQDTLVLRGGYGRSYLPTNTGYFDGPFTYGTFSFAPYTEVKTYGTNPNGTPVGHFWDDGTSNVILPTGAQQLPQTYGTGGVMFNRHGQRNGSQDQWNFFIEKRLKGTWLVSAGYVGSRGRNLQLARLPVQNLSDLADSTLNGWKQTYFASNATINPAYDYVPNPYQPASGELVPFSGYLGNQQIQRYQTMLPYPMLSDAKQIQSTQGFSNYNALQVRVSHAFSSGLELQSHYTWSKALEFAYTELQGNQGFGDTSGGGGFDLRNPKNNKSLATTDMPHRFVGLVTYDLPLGKGKAVDPHNSLVRHVLDNWTLGGVVTLQSGQPFGAGGFGGSMNGRGDRVPGADVEVPKELQRWYDGRTQVTLPDGRVITPCANCFLKYNPDVFRGRVVQLPNGEWVADQFWFGAAARTYADLRGPGRNNVDLSIIRQFTIRENLRLEFLANFTNVFNHTQFMSDSYNSGSGTVTAPDPASHLVPGMNSNSSFGTHNMNTYEPRQLLLNLRLRF